MRPTRRSDPLIGGSLGTFGKVTISNVKAGAFSTATHDGRQAGIYGTSRYGRCRYGLPRRGIYGSDTYGNCTYS